MRLACIMRMKDEEERILEFIKAHPFIDQYCVVDNGSTDSSSELLHDLVGDHLSYTKTESFQEGRDKNLALQMAMRLNPEWVLWMDWDEIFEDKAKKEFSILLRDTGISGWSFPLYAFWKGRTHYRVDHAWGNFPNRPQLRLVKAQSRLVFSQRRIHAGTFLGLQGSRAISSLRIKHYTVENMKYAKLKYDRYRKLDPNRPDGYKHLINEQGIKLVAWKE